MNEHVEINRQPNTTMKKALLVIALVTVVSHAAEPQPAVGTRLASSPAQAEYVLYDDFSWPNTTLDRAKWWRGGLDGVDGTNAILNESDLTSSVMFSGGDFKFVIGGPSASSQGLFGLGDIDDGEGV